MSSPPYSPPSSRRIASDATTSYGNEETASTHSIERNQLRALRKKTLNKVVPKDAVRRAVEQIWSLKWHLSPTVRLIRSICRFMLASSPLLQRLVNSYWHQSGERGRLVVKHKTVSVMRV